MISVSHVTMIWGVLTIGSLLTGCTATQQRASISTAPASDKIPDWQEEFARATEIYKNGEPERAAETARTAVAMAEAVIDPDSPDLIKPLLAASSFLMQAGDMDGANELAGRAHVFSKRGLETALEREATTLKFLGALSTASGRFDEAVEINNRAVQLSELAAGPDHPETAKHLGNLASVEVARGNNTRAREIFERAIAIWNAQASAHPTYAAGAMMDLAMLDADEGQPDRAVDRFRDGLALQEAAFGERDPRLQNSLRRFALLLRRFDRTSEAEAVESRFVQDSN